MGVAFWWNPFFAQAIFWGFVFLFGGWLPARHRRRRLLDRLGGDPDDVVVTASYGTLEKYGDPGPMIGGDDGLLSHVDGWLVFRGERTDWAVRTSDVIIGSGPPFSFEGPALRHRCSLTKQGAGGFTLHSFATGERQVNRILDEWFAHPVPDGEPRFPPVLPPSRGYDGKIAVHWLVLIVGGFGVSFGALFKPLWGVIAAASILLLIGLFIHGAKTDGERQNQLADRTAEALENSPDHRVEAGELTSRTAAALEGGEA